MAMPPRPPFPVLWTMTSRFAFPWSALGTLTWWWFARQLVATELDPRTLLNALVVTTPLFPWFVWGLILMTKLVVCTTLLLRLMMTIEPFVLCNLLRSWTSPWPLCRRRLTDGLLRTQSIPISPELTRAVSWTCRSLLFDSECDECESDRQFSFMLTRKCRCLWTLPMILRVTPYLPLATRLLTWVVYLENLETDTVEMLVTSRLLTWNRRVLPPRCALL